MKDKSNRITAVITVALVGVMIGLFMISNGSTTPSKPLDPTKLSGLQETAAPWQPESTSLSERITAIGLPEVGNESFHQHALLKVYIEGKEVPVPDKIGSFIGGLSSLHTHRADGVIHMEAGAPYGFTLGQFLDVWGVKLTKTQLGSYKNNAGKSVQAYVNGTKIDDPAAYQLKQKDKIVLGFGKDGEVPTTNPADFPKDL